MQAAADGGVAGTAMPEKRPAKEKGIVCAVTTIRSSRTTCVAATTAESLAVCAWTFWSAALPTWK